METLLNSLLQSTTETEVLEFKKAKNQYDKDKLGKYFSALSNEANLKAKTSAWLLFGVNNQKQVVGTSISDVQLNDYKAEMANHTSPRLSFESITRIEKEGKQVILCKIPPAPQGQPVSWKGHYYGRDGESLGALHDNERDRIKIQNKALDWSAKVITDAGIEDLSKEAIDFARKQYIEKNKKIETEILQWDDVTFLNKAKVTINGKITHAAIVLLGKPESDHYLNPAQAKISWILRDKNNVEKDYEHFGCPFILTVNAVKSKIRNLKYRYIKNGTLFPDEVDQFDPYIIRESLNNCIAHQDYTMNGKINVVEREDGVLTFSNMGTFIPQSVEYVIINDAPESMYRNSFLANAMVNLNMIDTTGSGIKRMYTIQRKKYFPLPDYNLENNKVQVTIVGKILDDNYARKLAELPDLSLETILLLDKVSKAQTITDNEAKILKTKGLIEGRKPNYYVAASVAKATKEKAVYIKNKAFDKEYYKKLIIEYISKYSKASRIEIDELIVDKLSNVLSDEQKRTKVRNLLYEMSKKDKIILNQSKLMNKLVWVLFHKK